MTGVKNKSQSKKEGKLMFISVSDNPADVPQPDNQAAGQQRSVSLPLLRSGSEGDLALLQPQHHQEGSFLIKVGDLAGGEWLILTTKRSRGASKEIFN